MRLRLWVQRGRKREVETSMLWTSFCVPILLGFVCFSLIIHVFKFQNKIEMEA